MKTALITILLSIFSILSCLAGGNSSVAELEKISSIKVEKNKITIVGTGMIRKRVLSDSGHGDATVFGQPAQMLHAKVRDCVFEIVPYHVNNDLKGVPGPDPRDMTAEMIKQSEQWWAGTLEVARKIKIGDAITIGYQREQMTLTSVWVSKVIGSGSLRVRPAQEDRSSE